MKKMIWLRSSNMGPKAGAIGKMAWITNTWDPHYKLKLKLTYKTSSLGPIIPPQYKVTKLLYRRKLPGTGRVKYKEQNISLKSRGNNTKYDEKASKL